MGLHQWTSAFGDTTNLIAQMLLSTDLANFEKLKTQDCSYWVSEKLLLGILKVLPCPCAGVSYNGISAIWHEGFPLSPDNRLCACVLRRDLSLHQA